MNKVVRVDLEKIQRQMSLYLQKHWRFFLTEGVVFILLGLCAIILPQLFTLALTVILGWLILLGGLVLVFRTLVFRQMPGFSIWFFIGILQVLVGYLLLVNPAQGALTLTVLLMLLFFLEGLAKITAALLMRPLPHWEWLFFSGFTALVFAIVVWIGFPWTGQWLLGLLLGVNMIFLGWSLVKVSLRNKLIR
ncbi:MAG: HdeD family acid-resistance protein [Gammaproteobacteria bacterium]